MNDLTAACANLYPELCIFRDVLNLRKYCQEEEGIDLLSWNKVRPIWVTTVQIFLQRDTFPGSHNRVMKADSGVFEDFMLASLALFLHDVCKSYLDQGLVNEDPWCEVSEFADMVEILESCFNESFNTVELNDLD